MARPMRPREFDRPFSGAIRSGLGVKSAARLTGMSASTSKRVFRKAGGVNPVPVHPPVGRYLSWVEREDIAALTHAGHGVREIARRTGRSPATISRELSRGATGRGYRASVAQSKIDRGRTRARGAKLATNLRLRRAVQADRWQTPTRLPRRSGDAGVARDDLPRSAGLLDQIWVHTS